MEYKKRWPRTYQCHSHHHLEAVHHLHPYLGAEFSIFIVRIKSHCRFIYAHSQSPYLDFGPLQVDSGLAYYLAETRHRLEAVVMVRVRNVPEGVQKVAEHDHGFGGGWPERILFIETCYQCWHHKVLTSSLGRAWPPQFKCGNPPNRSLIGGPWPVCWTTWCAEPWGGWNAAGLCDLCLKGAWAKYVDFDTLLSVLQNLAQLQKYSFGIMKMVLKKWRKFECKTRSKSLGDWQ